MNKDTGGPAFPTYHGGYTKCDTDGGGMTLRDYFAAKAMSAYISRPTFPVSVSDDELAFGCYELADAMLKARKE